MVLADSRYSCCRHSVFGFQPGRGTVVENESNFIGQHFWLLSAVYWIFIPRLRFPWIRYSGANKEKRIELLKVVGFYIGVASVALWIIQLTSGSTSDPFPSSWHTPQRWLALIPILSVWVAMFWWSFVRGGAQLIADAFALKLIVARAVIIGLAIFSITSIASTYRNSSVDCQPVRVCTMKLEHLLPRIDV